jgi:hypothetical protein
VIKLLDHHPTLSTFVFVLMAFGFLPGFMLRIILLAAYRPDDPRRHELLGELYAMSRLARPLWVAQQCETALFEGRLADLVSSALRRRTRERKSVDLGRLTFLVVLRWIVVKLGAAFVFGTATILVLALIRSQANNVAGTILVYVALTAVTITLGILEGLLKANSPPSQQPVQRLTERSRSAASFVPRRTVERRRGGD